MAREYQPKTGQLCTCQRGVMRDNCPMCEGTGWVIDFFTLRQRVKEDPPEWGVWRKDPHHDGEGGEEGAGS